MTNYIIRYYVRRIQHEPYKLEEIECLSEADCAACIEENREDDHEDGLTAGYRAFVEICQTKELFV